MIGLSIRFPAGRFHATPWGRHVNEAVPEWPPSPWRLLRALVATWKRKLNEDPLCMPEVVESLLRKLSSPPEFFLPPATVGHTRHYMPWYKKGPQDRTMVFDAFVALEKSVEMVALWPDVFLEEGERVVLSRIVDCLGFLGRAESWSESRVLSDAEASDAAGRMNCYPAGRREAFAAMETVSLLCADPMEAFENEYTPKISHSEGRGKAKLTAETPLYDPDWHLSMETLELHEQRWSDPPGSQWVHYLRSKDCFAVEFRRRSPLRERERPKVARFAFDSPVLPLVEETLKVAELARRTAMGCFRRAEEERFCTTLSGGDPLTRSEVFSGKNELGEPLSEHVHAFYLPTDEDGDGRLDHLTIIAEMGFGASEVRALDRMRSLKREQGEPIHLLLLGVSQRGRDVSPRVLGPSRCWVSATPFIATRYPKSRGQKRDRPELLGLDNQRAFARQVLLEELARWRERCPEIPEPLSVEPLNADHRCGAHRLRPIQFKRFRQKRSDDGGRRAAGAFRIVFPEEVQGPVCLGHSAHFGMGLFVPEIPTK